MALDLRANTAVDVLIGPFVDDSDGNTDETGLTITQADIRLSKNGQNMAQKNDANACAHDELGYYNCPLDATDTDTEGTLVLCVHESGALPVRHEFNVMAEAAWDSLYVAKDNGFMDVNIKTVGRTDAQETEADNLESACSNYSVTRGLAGTALPAAAADAAGGVPVSDAGGLDLDTILGRITGNVALASVVGALADAAADGDPTNADTLMQYIKQLINILIGSDGIVAFPAESAPGNAVSLAEVIRAIHADVTGLNGSAMRGTNNAALAATALSTATWTAARAGYLDELAAANIPADVDTLLTRIVGTLLAGNHPVGDAAGVAAGLHAVTNALIAALNDISVADLNAATPTANLSAAAVDAIADEEYDNDGAAISLREAIRIMLSALSGLSNGGGTPNIRFRDIANTKNRITATVDANGNRMVVVRDGT